MDTQQAAYDTSQDEWRVRPRSYGTRIRPDEKVVTASLLLRRGQHLFRSGDPVDSVFTVQQGVLKSYQLRENGDEAVIDFYYPGDLICLNEAGNGRALCNALALDAARVERLPARMLQGNAVGLKLLVRGMQQEIEHMLRGSALKVGSAEQRLASFLLQRSRHTAAQGGDPALLMLPMSRRDIALYLGLATETVSRVIGRLCDRGLLAAERRNVHVLDFPLLQQLSG